MDILSSVWSHRGDGSPGSSLDGRRVHLCGRGYTGSLSAGHTWTPHLGARVQTWARVAGTHCFLFTQQAHWRGRTPAHRGPEGLVPWSPQAQVASGGLAHPAECGLAGTWRRQRVSLQSRVSRRGPSATASLALSRFCKPSLTGSSHAHAFTEGLWLLLSSQDRIKQLPQRLYGLENQN